MQSSYFLSAVAIVFSSFSHVHAQESDLNEWSQWRGPKRDGIVSSADWGSSVGSEQLKQKWKIELGPSYSGPLVVGDRVYSTETRNKQFEVVLAFDRNTGEKLWENQWEGAMNVPFFAKRNGDWIRSTPAYDNGKLYVAGMNDVLVCLDAETGKTEWQVDFPKKFGSKKPEFGFVCSPLVDGDFVYVQAGGAFYKLGKSDGDVIWKSAEDGGGMYGSAFSSPVFGTINGVRQLVIQSRTELIGIEDEKGSVLWRQEIEAFRGMNILTPTIIGNSIFTSSYGGKSLMFDILFESGTWQASPKWQVNSQGYMSSPVIVAGHLYMHLRNQRFSCIELATGTEKWRSKPYGQYASLIGGDDRILALDQRGKLLMINANPEKFEVLSERTVSENETWAHLAVQGNQLFVRELNGLIAFEWVKTGPSN